MRHPRSRRVRLLAAALLAGALAAPAGWFLSDHLEQDNDFCNACHLPADPVTPSRPLHEAIRRDFDAAPSVALASVHGAARVEGRHGAAFRCIDCHGGTSFVGRLRVKALAAKDALVYLGGRFEEPQSMRFPLWDEDCRKCHARFREAEDDGRGEPPFHALPVHNVKLGVACVECHEVHETDGNPRAFFLRSGTLRAQCARCHSQFEAG